MTIGDGRNGRLGALLCTAAAAAAIALAGTTARASSGAASLPPTWHVHDCTAAPCTWPHAGVAFFPRILGESTSTYLGDPAECPDATDKALLGGGAPGPAADGLDGNQPLREGVCMTSTTVIHLKTITPDQQVPQGWSFAGLTGGWATYYLLTSR